LGDGTQDFKGSVHEVIGKKTGEMDTDGIPEAHVSLSPHVVNNLLLCG
jgi:hypothetical protein